MELDRFNKKWGERQRHFHAHVNPPLWAPGLIITPEIRVAYDTWLPLSEYFGDLWALARTVLPHESWIPRVLRDVRRDGRPPTATVPLSVPDLWATLPERFAGRLCYAREEVLPLLCHLAAPSRYGTAPGRYPAQRRVIEQFAALFDKRVFAYCDLGCGTAEGTVEIVKAVYGSGCLAVRGAGVSIEPLEIRVAVKRHSGVGGVELHFVCGDVCHPPLRGPFDLITVNGLVGGPAFEDEGNMCLLLESLFDLLACGGMTALANRFHSGQLCRVERFRSLAIDMGWETHGSWDNLFLFRSERGLCQGLKGFACAGDEREGRRKEEEAHAKPQHYLLTGPGEVCSKIV